MIESEKAKGRRQKRVRGTNRERQDISAMCLVHMLFHTVVSQEVLRNMCNTSPDYIKKYVIPPLIKAKAIKRIEMGKSSVYQLTKNGKVFFKKTRTRTFISVVPT